MDTRNERIAGIDYGTVRIGIALADTEVGIASPYANYTRRTPALDAEYFARLTKEEQIARFVVGLPVHLDGGESQKSTEARSVWGLAQSSHGRSRGVFRRTVHHRRSGRTAGCGEANQETAAGTPRSTRCADYAYSVPGSRRSWTNEAEWY